jgi:hypothetical protein
MTHLLSQRPARPTSACALHEAAHLIAAEALNIPWRRVRIFDGGGGAFDITDDAHARLKSILQLDPTDQWDIIEGHLIVTLAGPCGEIAGGRPANRRAWRADERRAGVLLDLAQDLDLIERQGRPAIVQLCIGKAARIVARRKRELWALAYALSMNGVLTRPQALDVLRSTRRRTRSVAAPEAAQSCK